MQKNAQEGFIDYQTHRHKCIKINIKIMCFNINIACFVKKVTM